MGNFYTVEAGGNGFAACKQKKNSSQGSKADKPFFFIMCYISYFYFILQTTEVILISKLTSSNPGFSTF